MCDLIERLRAHAALHRGLGVDDDDEQAQWARDLLTAADEIERLTAENGRLRADLLAGRNVVNAGLTIHTLTIERDMLRQEIEELRRQFDPMGEYASADELISALHAEKAEDEAMKRDAECWRELDQMMSDPDAELSVNASGWAVLKCGLLRKLGGGDA